MNKYIFGFESRLCIEKCPNITPRLLFFFFFFPFFVLGWELEEEGNKLNAWEDVWEDEDEGDDFSVQLKYV